jgi:hypothetical protein
MHRLARAPRAMAPAALAVLAAGLGLAMLAQPAHAGPVEQLVELQIAPDPQTMVIRYLNGGGGILYSSDAGSSWQLQCNAAMLGAQTSSTGPFAILGDGTMILRTSDGMSSADAKGCGWHKESPELTKGINDFVVHPGDAKQVLAVRGTTTGDSADGVVLQRAADGTWSELGVHDSRLPVSVRAAMVGDKLRLYEIGLVIKPIVVSPDGGVPPPEYLVRVSDDGAKTWKEYPLTLDSGTPRLRAVDPTDPMRVLIVVSSTTSADDLLVSSDGGMTFKPYGQITDFGGITFAPDGKLWIGDIGSPQDASAPKGLWSAPNLGMPLARVAMSDYPIQCIGYSASNKTLYACQHFWFGTIDQASGQFTTAMKLTDVGKFLECPGETPAASCQQQLCLDYCGPGHFAIAPVCSAYNTPSCGIPVAMEEGGIVGTAGSGAAGSSSATAGSMSVAGGPAPAGSGNPVAGASGAPAAVAGSSSVVAGGMAAAPPPAPKSSGCSVGTVGAVDQAGKQAGRALAALVALCGLALIAARRRRSRA